MVAAVAAQVDLGLRRAFGARNEGHQRVENARRVDVSGKVATRAAIVSVPRCTDAAWCRPCASGTKLSASPWKKCTGVCT